MARTRTSPAFRACLARRHIGFMDIPALAQSGAHALIVGDCRPTTLLRGPALLGNWLGCGEITPALFGSLAGDADLRRELARGIALGHGRERDRLDGRGVARSPEL